MRCRDWCGQCYASVRGREGACSGARYKRNPPHSWRWRRLPVPRPQSKSGPGGIPPVPRGEWAASFPSVWEFLSCPEWADGATRVPGSITLFSEDGMWKACLNDKDGQLVAFVSGKSPEAMLEAMEAGLESGALDWRKSRQTKTGRGQKGT